ncbi:hypothetical protein, partial [Saccharothrix syringae]|uniref:hypothetical protein n=1 Tax=Saccharothrix syringae TaxID=103733 RepID=UPI001B80DD69
MFWPSFARRPAAPPPCRAAAPRRPAAPPRRPAAAPPRAALRPRRLALPHAAALPCGPAAA